MCSPFFAGDYLGIKKDGITCLVSSTSSNEFVNTIIFLIVKMLLPVVGITITILCYIYTKRKVEKDQLVLGDKINLKVEKLLMYPIVLFAAFLPSMIYWFLALISPDENRDVVADLCMLITHSVGIMNALVYGLQRRVNFVSGDSIVPIVPTDSQMVGSFSSDTRNNSSINWESIQKDWSSQL